MAVQSAIGGRGSARRIRPRWFDSTFPKATHLRADLHSWLVEHAEFIADPANAALIRALIAAAAVEPAGQRRALRTTKRPAAAGLMTRLRRAVQMRASLRAEADLDAIAKALIGTLLLRVLNRTPPNSQPTTEFDGLLDAILVGVFR